MSDNDELRLEEKYRNALGLMAQLDAEVEHLLNKEGFPIEDDKVKSISDYLVFKAYRTFSSIRLLAFAGYFDDAYCLYRVLIENIVNFLYLSKNRNEIKSKYFTSELKSLKTTTRRVFDETQGLTNIKAPYKLLDVDMIEGMRFIAKVKKESEKIHRNDTWSSLSFEDRICEIGMNFLYLPYMSGSSLIHSSWFSRKGFLNPELHDDYITDICWGASDIYCRMIVQLNDNLINPDSRIEDRCFRIQKQIFTFLFNQD